MPIKVSWIDVKQIKVLDEQLDEFVKGFTFAEEESFLSRDGNKETQLLKSVQHDSSFQ